MKYFKLSRSVAIALTQQHAAIFAGDACESHIVSLAGGSLSSGSGRRLHFWWEPQFSDGMPLLLHKFLTKCIHF